MKKIAQSTAINLYKTFTCNLYNKSYGLPSRSWFLKSKRIGNVLYIPQGMVYDIKKFCVNQDISFKNDFIAVMNTINTHVEVTNISRFLISCLNYPKIRCKSIAFNDIVYYNIPAGILDAELNPIILSVRSCIIDDTVKRPEINNEITFFINPNVYNLTGPIEKFIVQTFIPLIAIGKHDFDEFTKVIISKEINDFVKLPAAKNINIDNQVLSNLAISNFERAITND